MNDDLPNISNSIPIAGMKPIVDAYKEIVPKLHIAEIVYLATFFAAIFIIVRIIKEARQLYVDNGVVDMKKFIGMIEQYLYVLGILAVAPLLFYYIELGFSYIQDGMLRKFKLPETALDDVIERLEEGGDRNILDVVNDSIFRTVSLFTNFIEYIVAFIIKYALFMVIGGRFLFLSFLQIIQPFAIVAYLNDKTKQYTFKYIGHLAYSYLVIPFVIIADIFSQAIADVMHSLEPNVPDMIYLVSVYKLQYVEK